MPTFEGLPREIRNMIYELCLCVDGYVVPYPEPYMVKDHKAHKPAVSLLALNKRIRDEALPILFGKNKWQITTQQVNIHDFDPDDSGYTVSESIVQSKDCRLNNSQPKGVPFKDLDFVDSEPNDSDLVDSDFEADDSDSDDSDLDDGTYSVSGDDELPNTFWARHGTQIKHLALVYSFRCIEPSSNDTVIDTTHSPYMLQTLGRSAVIHELDYEMLLSSWAKLAFALDDTLHYCPNVKYVDVDIADLDCAHRCCRRRVISQLFMNELALEYYLAPEVDLTVSGVLDDREQQIVEILRSDWAQERLHIRRQSPGTSQVSST